MPVRAVSDDCAGFVICSRIYIFIRGLTGFATLLQDDDSVCGNVSAAMYFKDAGRCLCRFFSDQHGCCFAFVCK